MTNRYGNNPEIQFLGGEENFIELLKLVQEITKSNKLEPLYFGFIEEEPQLNKWSKVKFFSFSDFLDELFMISQRSNFEGLILSKPGEEEFEIKPLKIKRLNLWLREIETENRKICLYVMNPNMSISTHIDDNVVLGITLEPISNSNAYIKAICLDILNKKIGIIRILKTKEMKVELFARNLYLLEYEGIFFELLTKKLYLLDPYLELM